MINLTTWPDAMKVWGMLWKTRRCGIHLIGNTHSKIFLNVMAGLVYKGLNYRWVCPSEIQWMNILWPLRIICDTLQAIGIKFRHSCSTQPLILIYIFISHELQYGLQYQGIIHKQYCQALALTIYVLLGFFFNNSSISLYLMYFKHY